MNKIKYGRLTFIGTKYTKIIITNNIKRRRTYIKCQCDCGTKKEIRLDSILAGIVISCGCINKINQYKNLKKGHVQNTIHGLTKHPLFRIWNHMIGRCYTKTDRAYDSYGGRGIKVCKQWKDSFKKFYDWAINNGYQKGLSIDRINNDGNYEPNNCHWASAIVQNNNKRNNYRVKIFGETKTISEWAKDSRCVVSVSTLRQRICKYHWNPQDAVLVKSGDKCN